MRVAFDLDDTLIPSACRFPTERPRNAILGRLFGREPLRAGTGELLRSIVRQGHEVWIYTTSFRKPLATRLLFYSHGIRIRGVVNQDAHQKRMNKLGEAYKTCTKYPPAFGIDVLVDDSQGVLIESKRHGFEMVLVRPDDTEWVAAVKIGLGLA